MSYILQYNQLIQSGEIPACKRLLKVYGKLSKEIENNDFCFLDPIKSGRAVEFIERFCKHSKGEWAGQSVKLELFQKAFIECIFGVIDTKSGLRRFRETLFFVGRKNGKTTLLAGIALYMMLADGEGGAEIYSTATKYAQAKIVFDEVHNMIRQNPQLKRHIKKRKSDLFHESTFSKMQALSRNSETLDGLNAHLIIMDELHGVRDRNLYEVTKQSQSTRRQPLLIMITTAGTVRECIFDDMYNYACGVADGTFIDDSFLPIIYELDNRDEWSDPAKWVKSNPALGIIKKIEDLQFKVERAKNNPADLTGILTKDFNIRETAKTAWLSFDNINNESVFDITDFRGAFAIGGADLSITTDLTCATVLVMKRDSDVKYITQMYWLPEDNFESRVRIDKVPYDEWYKRGLLRLCNGNCINYSDVTKWFVEMVKDKALTIPWIYYDSYSAKYWVDEMTAEGFTMIRCIQGAKTLSLPMQMLGVDLQAKRVNYNNNNILKWCLTNTGILTDRNGNIVPIKNQSPKQRIDGTASLLNAYVGLYEHYNEYTAAL
ncbi:MAG: terminase large subunit [Oscillospiraceae bacterium]|jgi:phage terminase large subunit-like protein|nr:terminase large subunit [Oscillospiraceae bacterium]